MDREAPSHTDRAKPPWMRNPRWSTGALPDQSAQNLVIFWIFAFLWNLITALALLPRVKAAFHSHDKLWLLALIFPAIGLLLLFWATRRSRRIAKFGRSVFHLQTLPASPGGELIGIIHVPRTFTARFPIQLKLNCILRYAVGFGRNAHTIDRTIWTESQSLDQLPASRGGTDIPVSFPIPLDAKPSSDHPLGDGIRWQLEARCKANGVSYFSRFEVPVFITNTTPVFATPTAPRRRDPVTFPSPPPASDPRANLTERGITCDHLSGGRLRIHFAPARNRSFVILTTTIGLTLNAIGIAFAVWPDLPLDRIVALYLATTFFFVGVIMDAVAMFNWLATDEITVRYGSLTAARRGPLYHRQQTFKLPDISDIYSQLETNTPTVPAAPRKTKPIYHALILKTRDNDTIWLASDILQSDYAAWLADEIKNTLGIIAGK